jgi:hypothetical protein
MNPGTAIAYNGNSLQTSSIFIGSIDAESIPTKNVKAYALAHGNGSRIPYISYPSKTITVTGTIYGNSISALDAALDTFRSYFNGQDQNLDIGYASGTRRYIATVNTLSITRPGGLNFAKFSLEFLCTQPFGQNVSASTILNVSARTGASYTDLFTFTGTAPYQRPIFTLTYTAVTATGVQPLMIGNNNTGQQITISRVPAASDIIVIDTTQKTVIVNGVLFDFSGAFPEFPPGPGSIGYSDGFTSRTFNYNVTYNPMYL